VKFSFLLCSTHIAVYIVKWHQLDITLSQTVHKSSHLNCTLLSNETQGTISVQTVAYWNVTLDGNARTIAIFCYLSENVGSTYRLRWLRQMWTKVVNTCLKFAAFAHALAKYDGMR